MYMGTIGFTIVNRVRRTRIRQGYELYGQNDINIFQFQIYLSFLGSVAVHHVLPSDRIVAQVHLDRDTFFV